MICAWVGDHEIIPFDSIDAVTFDKADYDDTLFADVHLSSSKEVIRIIGEKDVKRFRKEYSNHLKLVSKAMILLKDIENGED